MSARQERKRKARAAKAAAKRAAMSKPGAVSKYARKRAEQINGNFRPTSPFEAA